MHFHKQRLSLNTRQASLSCIKKKNYFHHIAIPVPASSQGPPGFHLPAIMHVERNWYVLSTDPIGTFITRAYRERTGAERVSFGLETSGPAVPFQIDPDTGVVTVNDTLVDKVSKNNWNTPKNLKSHRKNYRIFVCKSCSIKTIVNWKKKLQNCWFHSKSFSYWWVL